MLSVLKEIESFWRCVDCGKLYWLGPKSKNVMDRMKRMLASEESQDTNPDLIPRIARGQGSQAQEPPDKKQYLGSPSKEPM